MAIKTIVVKGTGVRNEAYAHEILTPGHLVELLSTGKVQKNDSLGAGVEKAFAIEDDLQGNKISDNYAADALVQYEIFNSGDEVLAFLANGENAAIGDQLTPTTGGEFTVYTGDSVGEEHPMLVAKQAVDMSGSSAVDPSGRIVGRII